MGICPYCSGDVRSKCGEINVWHFAHKHLDRCDYWKEHESEWHLKWKSWFDKENVEYIKEENGIRHIADIYFDGLILELQASAMSPPERRNRELFWGKNLRWIVKSQIDRFSFWEFVSRDVVSGYKRGITGEVKPVTRKKKTTPIGTEDIFDRLQRVGEYPIMWKWKNPKRWIIMKAPPVFYIDLTE